MSEKKQIVLNHFGRSGSTVLAMMLQQHPSIGWLHEFFSHFSIKSLDTYNFTLEEMMRMVAEAAEAEWNKKPFQFVGHEIKLMNFLQNPSCEIEPYLEATADSSEFIHVVLMRKNTLRRILSVYKAMQTNVYHSKDDSYRKSDIRYSVDFEKLFDPDTGQRASTLPALLTKAQEIERSILGIYQKHGIPHHLLTYEDHIETSPHKAYSMLVDWCGLPPHEASVTLSKTGSPLRKELDNYDQVADSLAGSGFEWMLGEGKTAPEK